MDLNAIVSRITEDNFYLGVIALIVGTGTGWLTKQYHRKDHEVSQLRDRLAEHDRENLRTIGGLINALEALQNKVREFEKCIERLGDKIDEQERERLRAHQELRQDRLRKYREGER